MRNIKELLFALLLVIAGDVLTSTIPSLVSGWHTFTGTIAPSPLLFLLGPLCGTLLVLCGLVIGSRAYLRSAQATIQAE